MVTPAAGTVVLVPFPFSDLSQSKLRPAVVLAGADRDDWIFCQITSKPYADAWAVPLAEADFEEGTLRTLSYARPGKLFTGNRQLMRAAVGRPRNEARQRIVETVIGILRGEAKPPEPVSSP